MELFILLCMIFGIMAPIFIPIVGGIVWVLFIVCSIVFPIFLTLGGAFIIVDLIKNRNKKGIGTLLYERAQLEEERDKLLEEKKGGDNQYRPKPRTIKSTI